MKYRDLLLAVLAGENCSQTPVSAWRHAPVADQQAQTLADATLAFQTRHDGDFAKLTPASTWQSRDHGLEDRWAGDPIGRREISRTVIAGPEDWLKLKRLDPYTGFSGEIVRAAQKTRQHMDSAVPLFATVFNPLFQASQLAGLPRLKTHMAKFPDAVKTGLRILRANTLDVITALHDAGAEGIFLATQQANARSLSAADYAEFALADDLACLDAVPLAMLHLHGADAHFELFAGSLAILHYDLHENPPPWPLAGLFPRGVSTGPSPHAPFSASVIERLRRERGPFILAPGCALPLDYAPAAIDALVAAARTPLALHHAA